MTSPDRSRPPNSRQRLEEMIRKSQDEPKLPEPGISVGEAWLRLGEVEQASRAYSRAAELDPRQFLKSLYWQWSGLVRESEGDLEGALSAYWQWLELEAGALEPLDGVASLLVRLGRWTDLLLLRPRYLMHAEGPARSRQSLALYTYVLNEVNPVEDLPPLEKAHAALEVDSHSPSMRYLLGELFSKAGLWEEARREFQRVLDLDPEGTWSETRLGLDWDAFTTRLSLARANRRLGLGQEALVQLEALPAHPGRSEGLGEMAALLLEHARYEELLEFLPETELTRRSRAEGLLGLGRLEEALELLTPSSGGEPPAVAPQAAEPGELARARKLLTEKKFTAARELLSELVRCESAPAEAWSLLARALGGLGLADLERLALIQAEKVRSLQDLAQVNGCLWPAPPGGPLAGLRFMATSTAGKGSLRVSGVDHQVAEDLARFCLTLIAPRCENYLLEDPTYRDIHLHVSAANTPGRIEGLSGVVSEEAAAAVLVALAWSLTRSKPQRWAVYGRLELDGKLIGGSEVADPLAHLALGCGLWNGLLLPRSSAPALLRLPSEWWMRRPLHLCDSVDAILEVCSQTGGRA